MGVPGKILVIKPSSLGDIVHVFPALEILHRAFPDSELDFVVNPAFADILDLSPFPVRKKILFDRKKLSKVSTFFPELFKLIREIRSEQYETVVDFQGLLRSAFMVWLTKSCVTAGFAEPKEKLAAAVYSRKIAADMKKHAVERYVELANKLCGTDLPVPEIKIPEFRLADRIKSVLPEKYLVIVPGARWESKVFPPEFFASSFEAARKHIPELKAVITGSGSDSYIAAEIKNIVTDAIDLTGKTSLLELAGVMKFSSAVLTNDSGPMHVAAAVKNGVFALFGPTSPGLTGPYGKGNFILRSADAGCLDCMKRRCPAKEKYLCHRIDPEDTGKKIAEYIKNRK